MGYEPFPIAPSESLTRTIVFLSQRSMRNQIVANYDGFRSLKIKIGETDHLFILFLNRGRKLAILGYCHYFGFDPGVPNLPNGILQIDIDPI